MLVLENSGCTSRTYMLCHESQTTLPVINVKVVFSKPAISIVLAAAPECFADVVVQMNDDVLSRKLLSDGIPNV
jgi:hypothetical protein